MKPYVSAGSALFLESSTRLSMILSIGSRPDAFSSWRTLVSGKETSLLCGTTGILLMVLVDSSVWIEVF